VIGIIGGGFGGLFAARALARAGFRVTVFEPDPSADGLSVEEAFTTWQRPHVPQLRQPHSARSVLRKLMLARDPELYEAVLAGGMREWKFQLHGVGTEPHDPDLVGLLGRRTTFERSLREVVEKTPGVSLVNERVLELIFDPADNRRIRGVRTKSGELFEFETVIECTGRRSKLLDWLEAAGLPRPEERSEECGIVYYSRYFRFLPGVTMDQGPYPSGPSANLSTLQYTMNKTDENTFSLMLGVAPWVPVFKNLRDNRVHMDVARALPGMAAWLDPAVSEPIWRVEPFGGLINRYRRFMVNGEPLFRNLFVIGDSRFHTNPIFGWGMGMALQQACMLVDAFTGQDDETARMRSFEAAIDAYALDHYEASAGEDRARAAYWRGDLGAQQEPGTYEYFVTQVQPAAFKDQVIFQAVTRRLHLLDDSNAILANEEVTKRAARIARTDHTKMTRTDIRGLVEAASERAGLAAQPQMTA
jgi:flavin-dependent dehydrogenase